MCIRDRWWSAEEPLTSLLMNLTLVGVDNGVVRPFGRAQPFYNLFPFSQWPAPIFVIDRQMARIPDDVATGDYRDVYKRQLLSSGTGSWCICSFPLGFRMCSPIIDR